MPSRRGVARRSFARRRVRRFGVKYSSQAVPLRYKLWVPTMAGAVQEALEYNDFLEIQVFEVLTDNAVPTPLWVYYTAFARRLFSKYLNFWGESRIIERDNLIAEYTLRGFNPVILWLVEAVVYEKAVLARWPSYWKQIYEDGWPFDGDWNFDTVFHDCVGGQLRLAPAPNDTWNHRCRANRVGGEAMSAHGAIITNFALLGGCAALFFGICFGPNATDYFGIGFAGGGNHKGLFYYHDAGGTHYSGTLGGDSINPGVGYRRRLEFFIDNGDYTLKWQHQIIVEGVLTWVDLATWIVSNEPLGPPTWADANRGVLEKIGSRPCGCTYHTYTEWSYESDIPT